MAKDISMGNVEGKSREDPSVILQRSLDRPSAARVYDYYLGGNHNWAVDRDFAQKILALYPETKFAAITNREFLGRAVRFAVEQGIRQFVDIGSGLPSAGNVHEVADKADPDKSCRVVYIDNEPIAHAHATILLAKNADKDRHFALDANFFDRDRLWQQVIDSGYIDPRQPVCLLAVALLHFMGPDPGPEEPLSYFRDQLAPGSLLVLSHGSNDELEHEAATQAAANYQKTSNPIHLRTRDEFTAMFGDWPLVRPGVVWAPQWHPDDATTAPSHPALSHMLAGVAHKPITTS